MDQSYVPWEADTAPKPFPDIQGTTYEAAVNALWGLGIVNGSGDGKYNPDGLVTRAQMSALVVRAMGKAADADTLKAAPATFADVSPQHWARGFITLGNQLGFIRGDGGRFLPDDPITYAQAATMLVRALGYEAQVKGGYPTGYVVEAKDLGLLMDVNFQLTSKVSRAEAAVFLYNSIFRAPVAGGDLTWSQSIFNQPKSLTFVGLPSTVAPGQQIQLNGGVRDLVGKPLPKAVVEYRLISGSGLIDQDGLTVGNEGPIVIKATAGDLTETATLSVSTGLVVTPDSFIPIKGTVVQLTASVMGDGQRIAVPPEWPVKFGAATIDKNGMLTVNDNGNVIVQASYGQLTALSSGLGVSQVSIGGKPDFLVPGLPYSLTAFASDARGNPDKVPVSWSATGVTIDASTGEISSVTEVKAVVTATAAGVTETADIPILQSIAVSPPISTLLTGNQVAFSAKGVDGAGQKHTIEPKWNRSDLSVGIISAQGVFAGIGSGVAYIYAALGSLEGRAQNSRRQTQQGGAFFRYYHP